MTTNHAPYLRGRVAQVFDGGSQASPRWSLTDARAVRDTLGELEQLRRRERIRCAARARVVEGDQIRSAGKEQP